MAHAGRKTNLKVYGGGWAARARGSPPRVPSGNAAPGGAVTACARSELRSSHCGGINGPFFPHLHCHPTPAALGTSPLCLPQLQLRNVPLATWKTPHVAPQVLPTPRSWPYGGHNSLFGTEVVAKESWCFLVGSQEAKSLRYSHQICLPPHRQGEGRQCQGLCRFLHMVGPP